MNEEGGIVKINEMAEDVNESDPQQTFVLLWLRLLTELREGICRQSTPHNTSQDL